jgi:hypothetical protein
LTFSLDQSARPVAINKEHRFLVHCQQQIQEKDAMLNLKLMFYETLLL